MPPEELRAYLMTSQNELSEELVARRSTHLFRFVALQFATVAVGQVASLPAPNAQSDHLGKREWERHQIAKLRRLPTVMPPDGSDVLVTHSYFCNRLRREYR
jgi:hypothetical protein